MTSFKYDRLNIAMALTVAMFFLSCQDTYERVGEDRPALVYPQGEAENFTLTYTETEKNLQSEGESDSRVIAVLESPHTKDFENLIFPYRTFPEGILVTYYAEEGQKSTIRADYAIVYAETGLVDLQGNVVVTTYDGKILTTPQLYWDRKTEWIFTQARFTFTNPEEGTELNGKGMDFNRDFTYFNAHQTGGEMLVKEESS